MTPARERQSAGARAANLFLWLFPVAFLWFLYRDGLKCWFHDDDFAWLGLTRQVYSFSDVISVLFSPAAQGTIRPLSERGFFLLFENLFGFDDFPFRVAAFIAMSLSLLLLIWIARRMTGSPAAGCIAALVWTANSSLVTVMSWSSAWNQALCSVFLLLALVCWIRFIETGSRRYWILQLIVFVIGFGALEVNIVYPALAALYAVFVAPRDRTRRLLRSLLPLFVISVVYFFVHRAFAPLPGTGYYAVHFDSRIFATAALYGKWALLPAAWKDFAHSARLGKFILWSELLALLLACGVAIRHRISPVAFCILWFGVTIAPFLPLPDHHTEYYVTIPAIGLALLVAVLVAHVRSWNRLFVAVPLLIYFAGNAPVAAETTHWWLGRTIPIRSFVLGVQAAHLRHPQKIIVVDGVTNELFEGSMGQGAFYSLGIDYVYLTPGSELNIRQSPDVSDVEKAVLDPGVMRRALRNGDVVVYSIAGDHLRNITEVYERSAPNLFVDQLPSRADVGNPLYSWLLGPSWLPPESGVRWMPAVATLRLRSPGSAGTNNGNKLVLDGFCPETELKRGPRHLRAFADGISLGETQINDPESDFRRLFAMPASLSGRESVDIEIRVEPVSRKDGQDYGVVFGKIAIVP